MSQQAVDDFVNKLTEFLSERQTDHALALIEEASQVPDIQNSLSDVIPAVTAHLTEDVRREKPTLFNASERLLLRIAEKFEAEAVLLQLIEDVEKSGDDVTFFTLLGVLKVVLLRIPKKRLNSLGWGLNAVQTYLSDLPFPENLNLEEEEELLSDADPVVDRISHVFASVLPFYEALLENLERNDENRKMLLLKFILQLLGKPLGLLDLKDRKIKSRPRRTAESIVEKIVGLKADIFCFFELEDLDLIYDIGQIDLLALGVLYYLVLADKVCVAKIPKVYDPIHVFQHILQFVPDMFKYDSQFSVHNGLQLTEAVLNMQNETFCYNLLDLDLHRKFCAAITNTIIYNQVEAHRKKALALFRRYLFQFESKGRFLLLSNLMKVLDHSGMIGYLITQYKNMLIEELASQPSPYFTGQKLFYLLSCFCHLHKREESDLVELADQIVASLNLLRFLAIRDKSNTTRVWDYFKQLEKAYLEPLKKGLMLSRAHYELKVKELNEEGMGDSTKVVVTVAGQNINEMPLSEKISVLNSALTSFDVIESLLSRVNEIIEGGPA